MSHYAYRWRCPRCHWEYRSPIAVLGVTCPHHKGGGVAMKAEDESQARHSDDTMDGLNESDPGTPASARGRGPNLSRRSEQ